MNVKRGENHLHQDLSTVFDIMHCFAILVDSNESIPTMATKSPLQC